MIHPAALMFDLDGTLADTLNEIAASANLARAHFGLPPLPKESVIRHVGNGSGALVRAVVPLLPQREPEALAVFLRCYDTHLVDTTRLMPGALAVLQRYADRSLAVVTNKLQRQSERILKALGIRHFFHMVVGGDSPAGNKPSPAPLLHVLSACRVSPAQAVMIGDGVNDILAAKAARVPVVAVMGGVNTHDELAAHQPDWLIAGLERLPDIVK